jgi:hypothetical protein
MKNPMNDPRKTQILIFIVGFFLNWGVSAQDATIPVYINLNESQPHKVYEVRGKTVGVEYHDYHGQQREMILAIYDWKRNQVATLKLSKSFGLNNFLIKLDEVGGAWEFEKTYSFEFSIEEKQSFKLLVKLIPKLLKVNPEVDLLVNPIQFKCDNISTKLMEFYGVIKGGRAPYTTQWYVVNDQKTDFLYQPREEVIRDPGQTMVIRVDKSPDYYVMLYVTDACGNVEKKMLHIRCEDGKKKINSIFIEPLNKTLIDKLNANKS